MEEEKNNEKNHECCPQINIEDYDLKKQDWGSKCFYVKKHGVIFHMPIGIGKCIEQGFAEIKEKNYKFSEPYMILDEETGMFSARSLFAIDNCEEDENVIKWEPKTLYSKAFKGSFKEMRSQIIALEKFVQGKEDGKKPTKYYTWTVDCPKCWKKRGGATVVIFAEI